MNKIKRDISQLKKEIVTESDTPSMDNFLKFCARYYHRPVNHLAEIIMIEYYRHNRNGEMITCKSNLKLYCQLSVKYFEEIHKGVIGNPVKDRTDKYSLRRWKIVRWQEDITKDDDLMKLSSSEVLKCDEFNQWFEEYWQELISGELALPTAQED